MYLPNRFKISTYYDAIDYMLHMQRLLEQYVTSLFEIDYDFKQNIDKSDKPFVTVTRDKVLTIYLPEAHLFTPVKKDLDKLRAKGYTKLIVGNFENEELNEYSLVGEGKPIAVADQEFATAQVAEVDLQAPQGMIYGQAKYG